MDENTLIEVIKGGISVAGSTISAITGALITTLFLRKNTESTEFGKIKAQKYGEVINDLLDNGKMTYLEYYKCNNFLEIAKKADEKAKEKEDNNVIENKTYDFDWFVKFYDYASFISNEDVQEIWASIFEREVNKPGTTSISLLHSLSMMNSEQATLFRNVSRFALKDVYTYEPHLFIFISANRDSYKRSNITPEKLKQLERLGLIDCDFRSEFVFLNKKELRTGNYNVTLFGDPNNHNKILVGNVLFTQDGQTLYNAIDDGIKTYRPEIFNFIVAKLKARNCRVIVNDKEIE